MGDGEKYALPIGIRTQDFRILPVTSERFLTAGWEPTVRLGGGGWWWWLGGCCDSLPFVNPLGTALNKVSLDSQGRKASQVVLRVDKGWK